MIVGAQILDGLLFRYTSHQGRTLILRPPWRGRPATSAHILVIIDVAAHALDHMPRWNVRRIAQEAVRIGEEVQVRVEGEAIFTLMRHHDDEALRRHPAKFSKRAPDIQNMFKNMGADNRVKRISVRRYTLAVPL